MAEARNLPGVKFQPPRAQPRRCGLNPKAAGFQRTIAAYRRWLSLGGTVTGLLGCGLWIAGLLWPSAGPTLFGFSFMLVAAVEWLWSHTAFCYVCGACTKGPLAIREVIWCPACNNLNDPTQIGVDVSGTFDLRDGAYDDPIPRFLALTVLLGIMDHGQEISFEPTEKAYHVAIRIGGKVYELEDPPLFIQFALAQTVKAIAGLEMHKCYERQQGHFEVRLSDRTVPTDVLVNPTQFGYKVVLRWTGNEVEEAAADETEGGRKTCQGEGKRWKSAGGTA